MSFYNFLKPIKKNGIGYSPIPEIVDPKKADFIKSQLFCAVNLNELFQFDKLIVKIIAFHVADEGC